MYSGAEAKHCEKLIEIKTTEMANNDLDKYYKALDQAIMRYHGLKLKEINKIIKEYWVKTYKGNDIDTIEVIAEDEEGSGASKARRSYNYRVRSYLFVCGFQLSQGSFHVNSTRSSSRCISDLLLFTPLKDLIVTN